MNHSSLPITGEILFMIATINEFEGSVSLITITKEPEPTEDISFEEVYPQCPFPRPEGYENTLLIVEEAYLIPSNPILPSSYSIL